MVKPFPCDPDQKKPKKTQNLDIPDEKVYSASPNRVNLPGDDLFIASKEDVIAKMKLRRKKGYFNHPPDISKLLKTAPAKPHKAHMKSITQPKFSNQNILQFNSSINPEEFRSAVKATYPHKDRNTTKKLNYSEFKMQGLGESTITTIPSRPGK